MKNILTTLVGLRAHGLHDEGSDYDWRGVFVEPTSEILKLGGSTRQTSWVEGKEDDTRYEVGRFLQLAVKCNPSILEVMVAPVKESETTEEGMELRRLFDRIWTPKLVRDAFSGYAHNQEKKFLVGREGRPQKFAVAYLRSLWQARELLTTGVLPVKVYDPDFERALRELKHMEALTPAVIGKVMEEASRLQDQVDYAYDHCDQGKVCDMEAVNDYLLSIRLNNWN
jgi:hypothetical protein